MLRFIYLLMLTDEMDQGSQKQTWKTFLLPNMKELFKTNRMSHFPPFSDDFVLLKFNFKDWIFHSAIICGPELCKRDGMMKTMLATNIDGYPLRSVLL